MAEKNRQGEVICDRVPWSRALSRFVDKQIQQWLRAHAGCDVSMSTRYQVVFEKLSLGHNLGCSVDLQLGDRHWRGSQYAQGLHQSLIQTLHHLSPVGTMQPIRS